MKLRILIFVLLISSNYHCSQTKTVIEDNLETIEFEPLEPIRIAYGMDTLQFGELWMPEDAENAPLIMIIHGGCWLSQYDYTLMDSMALDLAKRGYASWNLEYRRTEDIGGGWPGTFLDIAEGLKYVHEIEKQYPIDKDKIILTGHSAGGHLALLLGAHQQMNPESDIYLDGLPEIKGIVSLAGIVDLETYASPSGCGSNVSKLLGGSFEDQSDRYKSASPINYLPLQIPQILINGDKDNIVPLSHIEPYLQLAKDQGEDIQLKAIPNVGHFEVITPGSLAWQDIVVSFEELLNR